MHVHYDNDRLISILRDFYNATGINASFYDNNFRVYSINKTQHNSYCSSIHTVSKGKEGCRRSDVSLLTECSATKEPVMHICHAGLVDIAVPIIYEGASLGYMILGQMRRGDMFSDVSDYILSLGLDTESMRENYMRLPVYDEEKIKSILNLAAALVKFILLEHMMVPGFNQGLQRALAFIEENLQHPISVNDIAENSFMSKSGLYKSFNNMLGCTVGEFLMKKRIERAKVLLLETELSVEEISQAVGFSSSAYFVANFRKDNGVTPLRYRKNNKDLTKNV